MIHAEGKLAEDGPFLIDQKGRAVAIGKAGVYTPAECYANVRRLVACWNACNGITTQSLETMTSQGAAISGLIALTSQLAEQCDEQVAALRIADSLLLNTAPAEVKRILAKYP